MQTRLAVIGFGEAGSTFARAAGWGAAAIAYDADPTRASAMAEAGVVRATDAAQALRDASLVLSLVTADRAEAVARDCAPLLAPAALWCDMNSVAPETKRAAARAIEAAGANYVDVAILAPVQPAAMAVPLLLAGSVAAAAAAGLRAAGFANLRIVGQEIGRASSIKMIRSVMIKGIEALTAEMMLAAGAAGVTEEVLASLDAGDRPMSWRTRSGYNLERMTVHGLRRAAEMEEAARTLAALGVEPIMTAGTIRRQREQAGKRIGSR